MSEIKQDTLLQYLQDEWQRMDDDYRARSKMFVKSYKQFRGIMDESSASTKSRLFLNRTKVACIAGVANVLDVLIPSEDFFEVVGRNVPDKEGSELTKSVVLWALRVGDFHNEVIRYVLQAAIIGTTFGKIIPREAVERYLVKEREVAGFGVEVQQGVATREATERVQFAQME